MSLWVTWEELRQYFGREKGLQPSRVEVTTGKPCVRDRSCQGRKKKRAVRSLPSQHERLH